MIDLDKLFNELVLIKTDYTNDHINYALFFDSENETVINRAQLPEESIEFNNSVCLQNYKARTKKFEKLFGKIPNRIIIKLPNHLFKNDMIEYVENWVNTCKTFNLLPEYVSSISIFENKSVVISIDKHTNNQLYIYVNSVRIMYAYKYFADRVMLMYNYGINFYIAYIFASRFGFSNMNHHITPYKMGSVYPEIKKEKMDICLKYAIGLYRVLNRDPKLDTDYGHWTSFCVNSNIENASKISRILKFMDLNEKDLKILVESHKDMDIAKHILLKGS